MTGLLFNSPNKDVFGSVTKGASDSIEIAFLAYREYAKKMKNITHPEAF